jgi:hypothetical protein
MRTAQILLPLFAAAALAQPPVAPTPPVAGTTPAVGRARGDDIGSYNVVQSFETGYRFHTLGGNEGKYRGDVNYGNGLRLLGSNLSVHSREGHGGFFDEILLYTQGLGNDPYQSATLRMQKNRLYRYDLLWRLNEYVNPALAIAGGRHLMNTTRRLQDHDFTLLPQSKFQFRIGYTGNSQDGPALSTIQLFDSRGDEFTPFMNVRRQRNEYRAGFDGELGGFKLSFLRVWDNFKEDSSFLLGSSAGANPADLTALSAFRRAEPYHGNSPLWRVNLRTERRGWAANARLTYVGASRNFALDESAVGTGRLSNPANRQTLVTGDARRPVTAGDLLLSFFPAPRLTITNNTSAYNTRIDGDSIYREINNNLANDNIVYFQFLGIRTWQNTTSATFRAAKWISLFGGYQHSERQIRSIESFDIPPSGGDRTAARQDNTVNSGRAGIRLKPSRPLTISLDGEIARSDRPFTPISDRNFHGVGARAQYKTKTLLVSGAYRQSYNTNSVSFSTYSNRARNLTFDGSWTPLDWFAMDLSYAKLHLDTLSGLAFFAGGQFLEGARYMYLSNIHSANLGVRIAPARRLEFYIGYSVNRDTGDGRRSPAVPPASDPSSVLLSSWQTFPLRFESPQARFSLRLTRKVRWNVGWQYYRYSEDFPVTSPVQDYRAHTGYASVLWAF